MNVQHTLPAQARNTVWWFLTALLIVGSSPALAQEKRPYEPGERLVYDVKVGGSIAAIGVL